MTKKHYNTIFIKILLILIGISFCVFLLQKNLIYSFFFCGMITVFLLVEIYFYIKNIFLFYDKTIVAILNNDFTADFSKHASFGNYASLFKLYETLKDKQNVEVSKDLIYRSILNNIETGVLILQKEGEEWTVFLLNDYFSKYFQVPKVSKWQYLKSHMPSLCSIIEERNFEEIKTSLQIRVEKQDTQTFVLQASKTKAYEKEYYIVLLDSIQKVIEKKEKEAWVNLMKVISHELMNSITPIRSLTQNLNEMMQQESLSKEDVIDIRESVSAIIHRSDHLKEFVESYRKLAMLPSPNKEKIELNELLQNALQIMNPLLKQQNIAVKNLISFNRWLSVDKSQMEQVLINLLTNSIYALEGSAEKNIEISSEVKNKRIFITISDTGNGIEDSIEDKIFLPFFTTRKDGAGIGLTLSKNIIEAHGGYLNYASEADKTHFTICLMESF